FATHELDVGIGINVVGALGMAVVSNPALISIIAASPADQCGFADPRIIVVLINAAIFCIICRVQGFGVAFGEHNDISIGQVRNRAVGSKAEKDTFDGVPRGLVRED